MNYKVGLITVYFGNIPAFFEPFLCSCGWNPEFDFIVFCDHEIPYSVPDNVQVIHITQRGFINLVNKKLEVHLPNIRPYKNCDFKPAFGAIFENYLAEYDFWGFCDSDLVLGNLSEFIKDEMLEKYEKLFTYGHLALIKNNKECTLMFRKNTVNSNNFETVIKTDKNLIFDEENGITEKFVDCGRPVYTRRICCDGCMDVSRFRINSKMKHKIIQPGNPYWKNNEKKNYKYQAFCVDCGKTYKVYFNNAYDKQVKKVDYGYIHKLELSGRLDLGSRYLIAKEVFLENDDFFTKLDSGKLSPKDISNIITARSLQEWWGDFILYFITLLRRMKWRMIGWIRNIR